MKNPLIKLNKEIGSKKVNLELGVDTHKDPTKRFRLCWWYIEAYAYEEDGKHYHATRNICDDFSDVTDIIKSFDDACELDGGIWKAVEEAMSDSNTVLYKKVFNAVVYSDFADVIDLCGFGRRDFNRRYAQHFKDGVLKIVGINEDGKPFGYYDYVHLFSLKYRYFTPNKGEVDYELKHPTPIFSDGENLIGIEFKAEAVEE